MPLEIRLDYTSDALTEIGAFFKKSQMNTNTFQCAACGCLWTDRRREGSQPPRTIAPRFARILERRSTLSRALSLPAIVHLSWPSRWPLHDMDSMLQPAWIARRSVAFVGRPILIVVGRRPKSKEKAAERHGRS